jgi:hypothetical protein
VWFLNCAGLGVGDRGVYQRRGITESILVELDGVAVDVLTWCIDGRGRHVSCGCTSLDLRASLPVGSRAVLR